MARRNGSSPSDPRPIRWRATPNQQRMRPDRKVPVFVKKCSHVNPSFSLNYHPPLIFPFFFSIPNFCRPVCPCLDASDRDQDSTSAFQSASGQNMSVPLCTFWGSFFACLTSPKALFLLTHTISTFIISCHSRLGPRIGRSSIYTAAASRKPTFGFFAFAAFQPLPCRLSGSWRMAGTPFIRLDTQST